MPVGVYPRRVKRHAISQPLDESIRLIPLTQGQNTIVDLEDFERLSAFYWRALWNKNSGSFYAVRSVLLDKKWTVIHMSREVLGCRSGMQADHRNRNSLDNRKCNLREATRSQNMSNRRRRITASGFKGVYWHNVDKKWQAQIVLNGKHKSLGYFHSPEEAARAYDEGAKKYQGEFAVLNFC